MKNEKNKSNGNELVKPIEEKSISPVMDNLTKEERKALTFLKNMPVKGTDGSMKKAPSSQEALALVMLASSMGLNPFTQDIILLGGSPYITINGVTNLINKNPRLYKLVIDKPKAIDADTYECTAHFYIAPVGKEPYQHIEWMRNCFPDMDMEQILNEMKQSYTAIVSKKQIRMSSIHAHLDSMAEKKAIMRGARQFLGISFPQEVDDFFNYQDSGGDMIEQEEQSPLELNSLQESVAVQELSEDWNNVNLDEKLENNENFGTVNGVIQDVIDNTLFNDPKPKKTKTGIPD